MAAAAMSDVSARIKASSRVEQPAAGRTPFIDHLRVAMTALVLFHHAALTYGASGGWYLRQMPEGSSVPLVLFCTLNQAFFMGFFFLMAAYFTPASYDRKGPRRFACDRLLRLGVPLLVFGFVLDALTIALARAHTPLGALTIGGRLIARGWFSSGPLWFAEALLIFTAAYMLCRVVTDTRESADRPLPGHAAIFVSALLVGAGAFLLRLAFPVGATVSNMQFGYFSSYIFLFVAGVAAVRGRWLEHVGPRLAVPWLVVSLAAVVVLLASFRFGGPGSYVGGWTLRAVIYAFFEPFFAWGVILGLLWLFRAKLNVATRWSRFLSARAYTVYVIHPPVLVAASLAIWTLTWPPLAKFALAGTLACLGSVLVSSLILLVPGARRIL